MKTIYELLGAPNFNRPYVTLFHNNTMYVGINNFLYKVGLDGKPYKIAKIETDEKCTVDFPHSLGIMGDYIIYTIKDGRVYKYLLGDKSAYLISPVIIKSPFFNTLVPYSSKYMKQEIKKGTLKSKPSGNLLDNIPDMVTVTEHSEDTYSTEFRYYKFAQFYLEEYSMTYGELVKVVHCALRQNNIDELARLLSIESPLQKCLMSSIVASLAEYDISTRSIIILSDECKPLHEFLLDYAVSDESDMSTILPENVRRKLIDSFIDKNPDNIMSELILNKDLRSHHIDRLSDEVHYAKHFKCLDKCSGISTTMNSLIIRLLAREMYRISSDYKEEMDNIVNNVCKSVKDFAERNTIVDYDVNFDIKEYINNFLGKMVRS